MYFTSKPNVLDYFEFIETRGLEPMGDVVPIKQEKEYRKIEHVDSTTLVESVAEMDDETRKLFEEKYSEALERAEGETNED